MKPKPLSVLKSLEEKYVAVMKKLQFGKLKFLIYYDVIITLLTVMIKCMQVNERFLDLS